jgi:hypothetical protein
LPPWVAGASPGRAWIVTCALRSLVEQARPGALRFSFALASTAKTVHTLLIDCAVHFVKANGATRPKVFKLRKIAFPPSARVELTGTMSFANMTTRRSYPGRHRIDLLINGIARPPMEFDVRPSGI